MEDDYLSGADSRLRKFLGGIRARQGNPVSSSPTPRLPLLNAGLQFLYDSARDFRGFNSQAEGAQGAVYGSVAQRSDPNQYGSVASRQFAGTFGPSGTLNPEHQEDQQESALRDQQSNAAQSAVAGADLNGRATAAYLQPFFSQLSQGMMQRRSLPTDPAEALDDDSGHHDG